MKEQNTDHYLHSINRGLTLVNGRNAAEALQGSKEWKDALKAMKKAGYRNNSENRNKLMNMMLKR